MREQFLDGRLPLAGEARLWGLVTAEILGLLLAGVVAAVAEPRVPEILLNEVHLPEVDAGKARSLQIDFGRALVDGVVYTASIEAPGRKDSQLKLGLYDPGEPLRIYPRARVRPGELLFLKARAKLCCPGMDRRVKIRLEPSRALSSKREPVLPVVLPVSIVVRERSQACRGQRLSLALSATLSGTLALYVHGMLANSFFLSRRRLALRLKPYRWDGRQHVKELEPRDIQQMLDRDLRVWRRVRNWLRSNPLAFGLPGRAYYETVELVLAPQPGGSQLILRPHANFYRDLEENPGLGRGSLFITAQGDCLFGVAQNRRFSNLIRKKSAGREGEQKDGKVDLGREELFVYRTDFGRQPSPGRSGWEVS